MRDILADSVCTFQHGKNYHILIKIGLIEMMWNLLLRHKSEIWYEALVKLSDIIDKNGIEIH